MSDEMAKRCPKCGASWPARLCGRVINDRIEVWTCEGCGEAWPRGGLLKAPHMEVIYPGTSCIAPGCVVVYR